MVSMLFVVLFAALAMAGLKDLACCDPLRKDTHCPPDAAFAGNASFDFINTGPGDEFDAFWAADNTTLHHHGLDFDTNGNGLALAVRKAGDAPTLVSHRYLLFGKVSVTAKAARGAGLVTTLSLKSDSGDEIDWELLGAYDNQAATNYFYDGKALFDTYNDTYALDTSSFDDFHTYTVEWTDEVLVFAIDGTPRRTWRAGEGMAREVWPQTPMQVKLGVWAVDADSDGGEVSWAGGVPDWTGEGPFTAVFQSVTVEDYAGWCNEFGDDADDVEYRYDERMRGWTDVSIVGCARRAAAPLATPPAGGAAEPTGSGDQDDGAVVRKVSSGLAALVGMGWLAVL
ncbi:glycoside hydrolase family 16 protein [Purpureocillium lilacinum]|nr:glycoside hydrolase family 16 protein [Purpureocillium lilacinum]OAQ71627.1 glycoside hydrolase family 16 protein [Purpureocillium lilacinum]OAQ92694.1 glycoside hydrolase family 16 protein [Purpureocillium lilacinum]